MGICKLGILKQNSYYPLLLSYFLILESAAINDITADNIGKVILIAIFQSLSSVYSGIFEAIIRYRLKAKNKKNQAEMRIRDNITKPSCYLTILLYIIISFLDAFTNFLFVNRVFLIKEKPNPPYIENGTKGILIFASCISCYFILGYKLDKYQFLALGIIIIASIFNGTMSVFNGDSFNFAIFGIALCINSLTGFQEVIEKYVMHFMFQSPFMILFIEGVIDVVILSISYCVVFIWNSYDIKEWFINNLLHNVIFSIVCIGYNCYRIKINQDYTPTHRVIADSFYSLLLHIIRMLTTEISLSSFGFLIGYSTVVFGCCVYNEIIIVNCCDLNRNTEREVTIRAIRESTVDNDILTKGNNNINKRESVVIY